MNKYLIRVDKNGTQYFGSDVCPRCNGTGHLPQFGHIQSGECFQCGGSGIFHTAWKEYTPEYAAKLEEKRAKKMIAKSEENNKKFFADHGFNPEGKTWVILGNTYDIKDELKSMGAKFSYLLLWHMDHDDPNYETLELTADQALNINAYGTYCGEKEEAAEIIRTANNSLNSKLSKSEYVGEPQERIQAEVKITDLNSYHVNGYSYLGTEVYVYSMEDQLGNVLVWKTSCNLNVKKGDAITIQGTVKDHSEYRGIKQTQLTRCKIL